MEPVNQEDVFAKKDGLETFVPERNVIQDANFMVSVPTELASAPTVTILQQL